MTTRDTDGMTQRIMERVCDPRASLASKMILRAAIRTAIDLYSSSLTEEDTEWMFYEALAVVRPRTNDGALTVACESGESVTLKAGESVVVTVGSNGRFGRVISDKDE